MTTESSMVDGLRKYVPTRVSVESFVWTIYLLLAHLLTLLLYYFDETLVPFIGFSKGDTGVRV